MPLQRRGGVAVERGADRVSQHCETYVLRVEDTTAVGEMVHEGTSADQRVEYRRLVRRRLPRLGWRGVTGLLGWCVERSAHATAASAEQPQHSQGDRDAKRNTPAHRVW